MRAVYRLDHMHGDVILCRKTSVVHIVTLNSDVQHNNYKYKQQFIALYLI